MCSRRVGMAVLVLELNFEKMSYEPITTVIAYLQNTRHW